MTKAELFDLIQDNWLSWKKKQQLKSAVEEYSSALLRQTDCSMLRDLLAQKQIELQKLGRGSIKEMPYKQVMADIGAITYVLKLMEEHQPVA